MNDVRFAILLSTTLAACGGTSADPPNNSPADSGVRADTGVGNADTGMSNADTGVSNADSGVGPAVCGNRVVEAGEACDDGNTSAGDGCDGSCRPEAGALGCRNMNVSLGTDGEDPDDSVFLTTAFNRPMTDVSEFLGAGGWKTSGPIVMCAAAIAGGKAALTLQTDISMAISLPLSNCLCRQFVAAGTTGSLYCAPSVDKLDFTATIDSGGAAAGTNAMVVQGAGSVMGEGDVRIVFQSRTASIDADKDACTPAACAAALAASTPEATEYTTGVAISEMTNALQGGTISITAAGHAFDDDPADGTADCEDWVAGPAVGALAGAALYEEDNMDVGNAKDVVTIERIAE